MEAICTGGQGTVIPAGSVAKATDGHTIGLSINGPLSTAPALFPNLAYDPLRDLVAVSLLVRGAQLLVVHPELPVADLVVSPHREPELRDALRTAHFSIGSGTRLAFEDVIALAKALREHSRDVPAALQAYEAARRPIVDKLVGAANRSADWYEHFPEHMQMAPWAMAWSYIQRSGRVDIDKLRQVSPHFVAGYEAWAAVNGRSSAADASR